MIPLRMVGDYGIMNGNNHGIFMGRIPENVNGIYYTIIIDEWEYNWKYVDESCGNPTAINLPFGDGLYHPFTSQSNHKQARINCQAETAKASSMVILGWFIPSI